MTTNNELSVTELEQDILNLLGERPLDEIIDALEGAFRRRGEDISDPDNKDLFFNTAIELRELRNRDFELSYEADAALPNGAGGRPLVQ